MPKVPTRIDTMTPSDWSAYNGWSATLKARVIVPVTRRPVEEVHAAPVLAQSIAAHMKRRKSR